MQRFLEKATWDTFPGAVIAIDTNGHIAYNNQKIPPLQSPTLTSNIFNALSSHSKTTLADFMQRNLSVSAISDPGIQLCFDNENDDNSLPLFFNFFNQISEDDNHYFVLIHFDNLDSLDRHQQQSNASKAAAHELLRMQSEQGNLVRFMNDCNRINDFASLSQLCFSTLNELGLRSSLCLFLDDHYLIFESDGVRHSRDDELMKKAHRCDRFIHHKQRTLVNDEHITVLIKNMPVDEPERYGRYKDHLALLVEGAEGVINSLLLRKTVDAKKDSTLLEAISMSSDALGYIDSMFNDHSSKISAAINTTLSGVHSAFCSLDLDEVQEEQILKVINEGMDHLVALYSTEVAIDRNLTKVRQDLAGLAMTTSE
ncbi:hypothetical protein A9Q99_12795 [Gammaproteobacteria bacterium 45_16_T64]|nr:hypothetical protein A9Q99_12795 [Gammaproteobacteria bacterium 45_16_T64]